MRETWDELRSTRRYESAVPMAMSTSRSRHHTVSARPAMPSDLRHHSWVVPQYPPALMTTSSTCGSDWHKTYGLLRPVALLDRAEAWHSRTLRGHTVSTHRARPRGKRPAIRHAGSEEVTREVPGRARRVRRRRAWTARTLPQRPPVPVLAGLLLEADRGRRCRCPRSTTRSQRNAAIDGRRRRAGHGPWSPAACWPRSAAPAGAAGRRLGRRRPASS